MGDKRHICIYCDTWESGGIESFLYNVLRCMDMTGLDVDIAVACLRPGIFTVPLERLGVRFVQLSGSPRAFVRNYLRFSALLRRKHYDAVHVNVFHALSLVYLPAAKRAGVPIRIAHAHGADLRESRTRQAKLLVHRLGKLLFSRYATELWACSSAAADFLFSKSILRKQAYTFIPNGIDLSRFRFDAAERERVRSELRIQDCFVVGTVGRLSPEKNHSLLLDVFAALVRQRPSSRLLLVGEGGERRRLEQKAAALGVADRVIFYGVTDRVERLLWAMDVFAFPSQFEGLGIAAVEAQAAGLPVVCSEQLPREALVTPWVRRVPPSDIDGWAAALCNATPPDRGDSWQQCRSFDAETAAKTVYARYTAG